MLYAVTHRTAYTYSSAVAVSHHIAHLRPRALRWQELQEFALEITPEPDALSERTSFHETPATFFTVAKPHSELVVTARSRVRVAAPILPRQSPAWDTVRAACAGHLLTEATATGEFRFDSPHVVRSAAFADYAAASSRPASLCSTACAT